MITIIDFYADWCGPCQAVKPILEKIAKEMADKIVVKKVNVDNESEVSSKYGVMSIPTLVLEKEGKEIERKIGYIDELSLKSWINNNL